MTSAIGNLNTFSYGNINTSGAAGKLYVPVSKSALLYSHFDHVSGVAARSGQQGVSISKLQILNALIDRASSITNTKANTSKLESFSDAQMDSLIKNIHKQIQLSMKSPYILSGAQPLPGDLFSIQA